MGNDAPIDPEQLEQLLEAIRAPDAEGSLAELRAVVEEIEETTARLMEQRDRIIFALALNKKIPRTTIAEAAKMSPPMVYKIRRDQMEKVLKTAEEAEEKESGDRG
jgi:hypothetical protein